MPVYTRKDAFWRLLCNKIISAVQKLSLHFTKKFPVGFQKSFRKGMLFFRPPFWTPLSFPFCICLIKYKGECNNYEEENKILHSSEANMEYFD